MQESVKQEPMEEGEMHGSAKQDNGLQLMEELDFSAPIKTKIIFSDSEDDIVSSQSNKQSENVKEKNKIDSTHQSLKDLDMPSLGEQSMNPKKLENVPTDIISNVSISRDTESNNIKKPVKRKLSLMKKESKTETDLKKGIKDNGNQKVDAVSEEKIISPAKRQSPNKSVKILNSVCASQAIQQDNFNKEQVNISETSSDITSEQSNIAVNENESLNAECSITTKLNDNNSFAIPVANKNCWVLYNQNPSTELQEKTTNNCPENSDNSSAPPESSSNTFSDAGCINRTNYVSYVRSMLNSVSVHLVLIMKAQNFYNKKISEDTSHKLFYRDKFIRYKYHLYDLSYTAILTIILPKENDEAFVKSLILNTISLAHTKSILCNEQQARLLLSEMIFHTKNIKQRLMGYLQESQNPILNQILALKSTSNNNLVQNASQILNSVSENAQQGIQEKIQCPNVTIAPGTSSMGTVLRDQNPVMSLKKTRKISDKANNKKNSKQGLNKPNTNTPPHQPVTMRPQCPSYNSVVGMNNYMHLSATRQSVYQTVTPNHPTHTLENINNLPNVNYNHSINSTSQPNDLRPTNYNDTFHTQPTNHYPVNNQTSIHGVEQSLPNFGTSFETLIHQATPSRQYNLQYNQTSTSQLPLSQSKPPWATETSLLGYQYRKPNEILNVHVPDEAYRSSISRDSGFNSPPTLDKNNEQLQQERLQQTPLITHVTSLNPNVVNIVEGPCHVCGKITNQKCVACYSKYYCSYACQASDWKQHILTCKI